MDSGRWCLFWEHGPAHCVQLTSALHWVDQQVGYQLMSTKEAEVGEIGSMGYGEIQGEIHWLYEWDINGIWMKYEWRKGVIGY